MAWKAVFGLDVKSRLMSLSQPSHVFSDDGSDTNNRGIGLACATAIE